MSMKEYLEAAKRAEKYELSLVPEIKKRIKKSICEECGGPLKAEVPFIPKWRGVFWCSAWVYCKCKDCGHKQTI